MGRVKPAVLPVPVCAAASRSRPERTTGMALRLDRRRGGVAGVGDRAQQDIGQAKPGELGNFGSQDAMLQRRPVPLIASPRGSDQAE